MKTTCPLDCFDGCSIEVDDGLNLKGDKNHPITKGFLCHHMNNFHKFKRITNPTLYGNEISIDEAVRIVKEKVKEKSLYFKGSGNLGIMQSLPRVFFAKDGADIAKGSLCDGAGDFGIVEGRGANLTLSPNEVEKSEVVVLWGRDPSTTNSHILPALKGKTLIVIDPYKTNLAKSADLHLQVTPRGDIYLAMLMARMAYMEEMEDSDFIENRCDNFDYYIDFVNSKPVVTLENRSGISMLEIDKFLSLIKGKKVSFLVGVGVQKYVFGHSVLRAIDSFAAMLGLFGKEGCGVGYLGDSMHGFESSFRVKSKKVSMPLVDFSKYDFVFIQGANPVVQMPCSQKIRSDLKKAGFVVYFGLYENETSKLADLIIPAKTFLEKEDLKLSYGHEYIGFMPKIVDSNIGISEYELTKMLGLEDLKSEKEYIEKIVSQNSIEKDGYLISKSYEKRLYEDSFYTSNKKFEFFDDFYDDWDESDVKEGFYLINKKYNKSLNSQFQTEQFLHVPPTLGYNDGDSIKLSSGEYECEYIVKNDENLRDDCFMIYSGHKNANALTPQMKSEEGECAVYQELKCTIVSS
jgi:anaerobic selenocysteine-containing dehydrogenase